MLGPGRRSRSRRGEGDPAVASRGDPTRGPAGPAARAVREGEARGPSRPRPGGPSPSSPDPEEEDRPLLHCPRKLRSRPRPTPGGSHSGPRGYPEAGVGGQSSLGPGGIPADPRGVGTFPQVGGYSSEGRNAGLRRGVSAYTPRSRPLSCPISYAVTWSPITILGLEVPRGPTWDSIFQTPTTRSVVIP